MNNKYHVENIEFNADGAILRGWLYTPANGQFSRAPAIVMAHGFAARKELYLDKYAEVFASAGFVVLVFDNRNFGDSDGEPRQEIDPWQQVRDYRHAITFLQLQKFIDPDKIGVWGTSYSGGHAYVVAAIDRRVKCVVAQVPAISGWKSIAHKFKPEDLVKLRKEFDKDRMNRFNGLAPAMIPIVRDPNNKGAAALTQLAAWELFSGNNAPKEEQWRFKSWRNEITLRSLEMFTEYEPIAYIEHVTPTPLLMILAEHEEMLPIEVQIDAFNKAQEPKKLYIYPGGHFSAYTEIAGYSKEALQWFNQYLK